jgi:hypothetical protein
MTLKLVNKLDSSWAARYQKGKGKRLKIWEIEQVIQQDHGIAFCLDHNKIIKNLDEGVSKHFFCVRIDDDKMSEKDWSEKFDAKEESDSSNESVLWLPETKD